MLVNFSKRVFCQTIWWNEIWHVIYGWKDLALGSKVSYSIEWMVQWKHWHFRKTYLFWQGSAKNIKVQKQESVVSVYAGHHHTHIIQHRSIKHKIICLYLAWVKLAFGEFMWTCGRVDDKIKLRGATLNRMGATISCAVLVLKMINTANL